MGNLLYNAINVGIVIGIILVIIGFLPISPLSPQVALSIAQITAWIKGWSFLFAYNAFFFVFKAILYIEISILGLKGAIWVFKKIFKSTSN